MGPLGYVQVCVKEERSGERKEGERRGREKREERRGVSKRESEGRKEVERYTERGRKKEERREREREERERERGRGREGGSESIYDFFKNRYFD